MARMIVVIDDGDKDAMDSGCIHDILQTASNHGTVVEAKYVFKDGFTSDLMHALEVITPEKGKC